MLQCCVCLLSVAKRCVLEQKLLLTAYRKSHIGNRLVPKWMALTFVYRSYQGHVDHCVYIRRWISRKPLEIKAWFQRTTYSDISRKRLDLETPFQRTTNRKWHMGLSNGHITDDGSHVTPKVLWGRTVGYPSDSLASCLTFFPHGWEFVITFYTPITHT